MLTGVSFESLQHSSLPKVQVLQLLENVKRAGSQNMYAFLPPHCFTEPLKLQDEQKLPFYGLDYLI